MPTRRVVEATAASSRSSSATPSWPPSVSPWCTRTTPCGPSARRRDDRRLVAARRRAPSRQRATVHLLRTGINTGEVVAGDPTAGHTLATGDRSTRRAPRPGAAGAGEVALGAPRTGSSATPIDAEPVEPSSRRARPAGRGLPVWSGRPRVRPSRRLDTPMIGRSVSLDLLATHSRVSSERCRPLVTLLGTAGVGKSHLVQKSWSWSAPSATVLRESLPELRRGRHFWPIARCPRRRRVSRSPRVRPSPARSSSDAPRAADEPRSRSPPRVASAIGLSTSVTPQEEVVLGVRRLLEQLAAIGP